VQHLFFDCMTAKYVWSLLAYAFGSKCRPGNFYQYWIRISNSFPYGKQVYALGLAAVCWAIWRIRNSVCIESKSVKSPTKIICMICSFITYWAGLQKVDMEKQLVQGMDIVNKMALSFHKKDMERHSQEDHQMVPYVG